MPFLDPDVQLEDAPPPAAPTQAPGGGTFLPPNAQLDDQGTPWYRYPAVFGGALTRGLTSLAGLPGDLVALGESISPTPPSDLHPGPPVNPMPTTQQLVSGEERLPWIGPALAATEPRTRAENFVNMAGEFTGSALPALFTGGASAPAIATRLPRLAVQPLAGATAEAGKELFPEHPLIGMMAGGALGAAAPSALVSGAGRVASTLTPGASDVGRAFTATGVTPTAVDMADSPLVRLMAKGSVTAPGGGALVAAGENQAKQFGQAVERTAADLGSSQTKIQAGEALQREANQYLDNWRKNETAAWNQVAVPPDAPVDVSQVISDLRTRLGQYPGAPALAKSQTNPELSQLYQDLTKDAGPGGTLQWQAAKNLRSDLGSKIGAGAFAPDRDLGALKNVWGNLTDAMGGAAGAQGMGDAFNAARAASKTGHDFLDDGGRAILNATPERAVDLAFTGTTRGGGSALQQIRQTMPDAANELGAYHLRSLATPIPSRAGGLLAASPESFLTGLNRLSPEARDALFPGAAGDIDNLQTVAGQLRKTAQTLANPSGTAATAAHTYPWLAIPPALIAGGPRAALTAASPIVANMALSRMLRSPAVGRAMGSPAFSLPVSAPTAAGYGVGGAVPQIVQMMAGQ